MARRRLRQLQRDTLSLAGLGIMTGVGSSIVTKSGGSAAGLASVSRFSKPIGTTIGGAALLGLVGDLARQARPRRARRR